MSRAIRVLLCAFCLLSFGLAAAPAFAQSPPPPPPPGPFPLASLSPMIKLIQTVTVTGLGLTEAEAEENAEAKLEEDYVVLKILGTSTTCLELELPGTDPFGNHETVVSCSADIRALVMRKARVVVWP